MKIPKKVNENSAATRTITSQAISLNKNTGKKLIKEMILKLKKKHLYHHGQAC